MVLRRTAEGNADPDMRFHLTISVLLCYINITSIERMPKMSRFVLRKVNTGIKFDLFAANGEEILSSEVYESRAACLRGVESVRKNAPTARLENQTEPDVFCLPNPKFELFTDKSGAFRFRLRSRNGKIIAVSDSYTTKTAALGGIESVRKNAPIAETE